MTKKMPQMARAGKNGHGLPRQKIACENCGEFLSQNKFSYVDKNDPSKGIRKWCKSCSSKRAEREREKRANNWKYKPTLAMLNNSKQRAKVAGLDHNITIEDLIIPDFCPVLGIKLDIGDRKTKGSAPSIDRIDNSKGYVKGNIMIISNRANMLKNNATIDELIKIGNFYQSLKGNT